MHSIFISYRRDDGIAIAKLLKVIVEKELSKDIVFLDTSEIKPEEKWRLSLKEAVNKSKAVLSFIGPCWKGEKYNETKKQEDNRLFESEDWVYLELKTALEDKKKKVIPILFSPNKIPSFIGDEFFKKETLPSELWPLSGENNITRVREKEFENDIKPTLVAISQFIEVDDALNGLELPPYNSRNPLDSFPKHPFKGLEYFEEKDARVFFGRGQQIRELFDKIEGNKLVLFYGQSGVGKSSLLFAGLKRRMENKGWTIVYYRRKANENISEKIKELTSNKTNSKQLVIIDQIEEIKTNPSINISVEGEVQNLIECVKLLMGQSAHVVLSFREEYLSWLKELIDLSGLDFKAMRLRHLQVRGVMEAILGITYTGKVKENFKVSYEKIHDESNSLYKNESVAKRIAALVLADEESHVAPLLQVLLRKLWDLVPNKDENALITFKLFEQVKSQSLNSLVGDQIDSLKEEFSEEVNNGLVLDLFYFFTTARATSASRSIEEINQNYEQPNIIKLCQAIQNRYLLVAINDNNFRLAHDALAPIIHDLFNESNLPGQLARRILESSIRDARFVNDGLLTEGELQIVEVGKFGMHKFSVEEIALINRSSLNVERIKNAARNRRLLYAVVVLVFAIVAFWIFYSSQVKEKNLVINSLNIMGSIERREYDINRSYELAEKAVDFKKDVNSLHAFYSAYYYNPFPYYDNFIASPFYKVIDSLKTKGDEMSYVTFSPDSRYVITAADAETADGEKDVSIKVFDLKGNLLKVLQGHEDAVQKIVFYANRMLSVGWDGRLISWLIDGDPSKWKKDAVLYKDTDQQFFSVDVSRDGKRIIIGGADNVIILDSIGHVLTPHLTGNRGAEAVSFSKDATHFLTADGRIAFIWTIDGRKTDSLVGHEGDINDVEFSPMGDKIITASNDYTAKVWTISGKLIKTLLPSHRHFVRSASFSSDGRYIVTSSNDKKIFLWGSNGELLTTLNGHQDVVYSCKFSSNNQYIISGSGDGTARLWNLYQKPPIITLKHIPSPKSVSFSSDGKYLAIANQQLLDIWNLADAKIDTSISLQNGIRSIQFASNNDQVLISTLDNKLLLQQKHQPIKTIGSFRSTIQTFDFNAATGKIALSLGDDEAKVIDLNGKAVDSFTVEGNITSLKFSRNGSDIVCLLSEGGIYYKGQNKSPQQIFSYNDKIYTVNFNPDGKTVIISLFDGYSIVLDLQGNIVKKIDADKPFNPLHSAMFSSDGEWIVTAANDHVVRVYDKYGSTVAELGKAVQSSSNLVAIISPDKNYILSYDPFFGGFSKLWNMNVAKLREFR